MVLIAFNCRIDAPGPQGLLEKVRWPLLLHSHTWPAGSLGDFSAAETAVDTGDAAPAVAATNESAGVGSTAAVAVAMGVWAGGAAGGGSAAVGRALGSIGAPKRAAVAVWFVPMAHATAAIAAIAAQSALMIHGKRSLSPSLSIRALIPPPARGIRARAPGKLSLSGGWVFVKMGFRRLGSQALPTQYSAARRPRANTRTLRSRWHDIP